MAAALGDVLGGRYRLVELLGEGGMATIYRATDAQLGRDVAVKVLRPEYGRDPDFVARFRQEAKAAASLSHPGIVGVYDFGADPDGPYIVMELVDGEDLASLLRRNGPLPPRQAARLVAEVARALDAAHQRGIVHRDVKPGNIMVTVDGRVKVTDFGIARAWADARLTLPGVTLGSVHYFSPEQALGEPATEASDVYSLGVVLYELLTGRRPFQGDSAASIAMARISAAPPHVTDVRPSVSPALEAIDRKALEPDPAARFATAGAMAAALETFLDQAPVRASGVAGAAIGAAAVGSGLAAGTGLAAGAAASRAVPPPPRPQYPPDAYAGTPGAAGPARPTGALPAPGGTGAPPPYQPEEPDEDRGGTSPWIWVGGALALIVLALIGFGLFRLLSAGSTPNPTPAPNNVTLPTFLDQTYDNAQITAQQLGVNLLPNYVKRNDKPEGTIVAQDPAPGTSVPVGSDVKVDVVSGKDLTQVPVLVGLTESDAIKALSAAKLGLGTRTEDFDPAIPAGSVIGSNPTGGVTVPTDTPVDYIVSKGPEPTPSPTPTPAPTPPPTPPPTPTPVPTVTVGTYEGLTVAAANVQATSQGLVIRWQGGATPPDTDVITKQNPAAGTSVAPGSTILLSAKAPATPTPAPTPPPTPAPTV